MFENSKKLAKIFVKKPIKINTKLFSSEALLCEHVESKMVAKSV